jgi:hypothetical protein
MDDTNHGYDARMGTGDLYTIYDFDESVILSSDMNTTLIIIAFSSLPPVLISDNSCSEKVLTIRDEQSNNADLNGAVDSEP